MCEYKLLTPTCPACGNSSKYDLSNTDLMFGGDVQYHYYKCMSCGLIHLHPIPDMDVISSFYPDEYSVYDENIKPGRYSRLKNAVLHTKYGYKTLKSDALSLVVARIFGRILYRDTIPYSNNNKMLDIGCGNGRFLLEMKQLGWQAEGVEFNDRAIEICHNNGLKVHKGDLKSANFPDDSFDLITARHLIEHVPEPDKFLEEVARILRPGGIVNIRTPNGNALGRILFRKFWFANDIPRHLFLFTPKSLDKLARKYGLVRKTLQLHPSKKVFLNSIDYALNLEPQSSKKKKLRRSFARIYEWLAALVCRGDEIYVVYTKK